MTFRDYGKANEVCWRVELDWLLGIKPPALPVRINEALPYLRYREAVQHHSPGLAAQPRHPGSWMKNVYEP